MRKLIVAMSTSLDAFVGRLDGDNRWMFSGDPEAIAWKLAVVANASLHIMGGRSFQDMAAFYPTATLVFAPPMNRIPKAVFSKQGNALLQAAAQGIQHARAKHAESLQPGADSWAQAHVPSGDLVDEVHRLKAQDGAPIVAHGGARLVRSLITHDLVDEYALVVHPIVLGKGLPIFTDLPASRPLRLVSSRAFPLGAMGQVYRPA